jgi:hypothetical protein
MRTLALAALALIVAGSEGNASGVDNVEAWYQHARATIGPLARTEELSDQRDVIAPPATIDPGIALLRIIEPPGTRDDGLHVK